MGYSLLLKEWWKLLMGIFLLHGGGDFFGGEMKIFGGCNVGSGGVDDLTVGEYV